MNDSEASVTRELEHQGRGARALHGRAVGSPLPMGGAARPAASALAQEASDEPRAHAGLPLGRALLNGAGAGDAGPAGTGFQRAVGTLKMAIPFLQRILPLLDGNVATAVSNLLGPHPAQAQPRLDLAPIEDGLAELNAEHHELREQVAEQNASLKRVEDQLEMVREATDRNTLEQQELMEDLKTVGNKVNAFAMIALVLLGISIVINVILFLHIQRVLP